MTISDLCNKENALLNSISFVPKKYNSHVIFYMQVTYPPIFGWKIVDVQQTTYGHEFITFFEI
jgi:hypothetical protein